MTTEILATSRWIDLLKRLRLPPSLSRSASPTSNGRTMGKSTMSNFAILIPIAIVAALWILAVWWVTKEPKRRK